MTWTKLGAEWPDEARDLSDAAYRLHVDALCYCNRRGYDLILPKQDLHRFAEASEPRQAAQELVTRDWWEERDDAWDIGVRFSAWQRTREQVEGKRRADAAAQRRKRLHDRGDHSECRQTAKCSRSPSAIDSGHDSGHESVARSARLSERNGTAASKGGETTKPDLRLWKGQDEMQAEPSTLNLGDWPGRCPGCGFHVDTQGHDAACTQRLLGAPGVVRGW